MCHRNLVVLFYLRLERYDCNCNILSKFIFLIICFNYFSTQDHFVGEMQRSFVLSLIYDHTHRRFTSREVVPGARRRVAACAGSARVSVRVEREYGEDDEL